MALISGTIVDYKDLATAASNLTPATLHQLVTVQAARTLAQHLPQLLGLVRVTGQISDPGEVRGPWRFGARLSANGSQIEMALPTNLVAAKGIAAGQLVRVTGLLRPRVSRHGVLELRLEADDIECCDHEATERIENGRRITLDYLKSLPVRRFAFPVVGEQLRIAVVQSSSASAQVAQDCLAELSKLGSLVAVRSIRVNILDPVAIADAVNRAESDVLIVVRGGGPAADFDVFDDSRVVSAFAAKPAYRVVGLGHSANATLLDVVADHSARTPAQAGVHVRECVESKIREWRATKAQLRKLDQQGHPAQIRWGPARFAIPGYWWLIAAFAVGVTVATVFLG